MRAHQFARPAVRRSHTLRYAGMLAVLLATPWVHPAQLTVSADPEALLETVEQRLEQAGWEIVDQAKTDRFALVYASHANDGFVTVTLRQLPSEEPRVELSVSTDSPANPALEQRLLQQFGVR